MMFLKDDTEIFTTEILACWRLSGVAAVLFQIGAGEALLTPLAQYVPDQVLADSWVVPISEREVLEAAEGVDGMVFYVLKDKIVTGHVLS